MNKNQHQPRLGHPFDLPRSWQWLRWPIFTLAGGSYVIVLWLDEEATVVSECAPVIGLPILAGLLYWFNHSVFKASRPRPEDLKVEPPISNKISKGSN